MQVSTMRAYRVDKDRASKAASSAARLSEMLKGISSQLEACIYESDFETFKVLVGDFKRDAQDFAQSIVSTDNTGGD